MKQPITPDPLEEVFLTRGELARRWKAKSKDTVTAAHDKGLKAIRLQSNRLLYRLSDVIAYEEKCAA